jgi:hypothetical protein
MDESSLERAPISDDIGDIDADWLGKVDCIVAGFSCQPWANVGEMRGTEDERWLWPAIFEAISRVRPSLVFLENVPGLVSGCGLNYVLDDLAKCGFDAVWGCVPAAQVGAATHRKREFILAYAKGFRFESWRMSVGSEPTPTGVTPEHIHVGMFAPGPDSSIWDGFDSLGKPGTYLQPAQSGVCELADGSSILVDADWVDQIRCVGNACVPTQAAAAFILLVHRANLI